jgi:hypothetical protein
MYEAPKNVLIRRAELLTDLERIAIREGNNE